MKITRIGPSFPLLTASTLGGGGGSITPSVGSGLVPVSTGSNSWAWGSNVQLITAGGSNVLGPFVNFAAGSNVTLTIDQAGAVASNTIRIHATSGAASFGSNSNAVSLANAPGASTDSSRADHVHLGVTSVAHSSNTYSGLLTLAPGTNMAITSPAAGTYTLHSSGGSASISAGSNSTRVREVSTAGASTTLWSPFDHAHDGIGTITASSSNTLQRGTVNLRPGSNVSFGLTDTDGNGEFDTLTISGAAGGGGGGGGLTQAYVGYNTVGATWETGSVNEWAIAKQITLANACLVSDVEVYLRLGAAGTMSGPAAALYADSAGAPGQILRAPPERGGPVVSQPATTPLWFGTNGLGWVAAGTYWLVVRLLDTGGTELIQVAYDAGSDRTQDFTAMAWQTWSAAAGSRKYSIRANTLR